ncbi:hypothetical protein QBC33DRAFT_327847 [Phialemonium atrogriseum]|uniref:Secreted protein n=1 Tax=Phialemonium atrogriseum TaxID=1093897 RepID=A0AAJ0FJ71_9PEZI|nr:uncharacterized protein QBC33DRAFT_327847 [Phialemonium atrogriseum]KAK1769602.1 hypothetical protein QBC33DRAFT_327847 [Phialemonium atrogriseum]
MRGSSIVALWVGLVASPGNSYATCRAVLPIPNTRRQVRGPFVLVNGGATGAGICVQSVREIDCRCLPRQIDRWTPLPQLDTRKFKPGI